MALYLFYVEKLKQLNNNYLTSVRRIGIFMHRKVKYINFADFILTPISPCCELKQCAQNHNSKTPNP